MHELPDAEKHGVTPSLPSLEKHSVLFFLPFADSQMHVFQFVRPTIRNARHAKA